MKITTVRQLESILRGLSPNEVVEYLGLLEDTDKTMDAFSDLIVDEFDEIVERLQEDSVIESYGRDGEDE